MDRIFCLLFVTVLLAGCGHQHGPQAVNSGATEEQKIEAERAKLNPEDRALVTAQEFCVVQNKQHLGAMGAPVKLTIKDQPVFLCCKACKKDAEADPDKTLATLDELKAKVKTDQSPKQPETP